MELEEHPLNDVEIRDDRVDLVNALARAGARDLAAHVVEPHGEREMPSDPALEELGRFVHRRDERGGR